jgi:hypothetical protein
MINPKYAQAIAEWKKNKYSDESTDKLLTIYNEYLEEGGQLSFSHFIEYYEIKNKCRVGQCPYLSDSYCSINIPCIYQTMEEN